MTSLALDALAVPLDRSLLHVFVAGPGYGEGIAVALPGGGWIVLDETTSPRCVGVTTSPTAPVLVFAAIEAELAVVRPSSLDQLRRRIVIDAMLALRRRFDAAPAELIALVDGTRIPLNDPATTAFVRAPDAALVHARLVRGQPGDPNELSAVVELVYGTTRIVLGSDLPALDSHGVVLTAGWDAVLQRHPHLGDHLGLKVPHHGSPAAFHAGLMPRGAGRTWWISPFNRGRRLPPTDPRWPPPTGGAERSSIADRHAASARGAALAHRSGCRASGQPPGAVRRLSRLIGSVLHHAPGRRALGTGLVRGVRRSRRAACRMAWPTCLHCGAVIAGAGAAAPAT